MASPPPIRSQAAFGLGSSAARIDAVDAQGVALAAIQGLGQLAQEQDAEIAEQEALLAEKDAQVAALQQDVSGVRAQNAALEARLAAIEARLGAGESR